MLVLPMGAASPELQLRLVAEVRSGLELAPSLCQAHIRTPTFGSTSSAATLVQQSSLAWQRGLQHLVGARLPDSDLVRCYRGLVRRCIPGLVNTRRCIDQLDFPRAGSSKPALAASQSRLGQPRAVCNVGDRVKAG